MATRALVNLPKGIRRGDLVEVKTAIAHPMETGYRQDAEGRMLPRDIVRRLEARLDGELVFAADLNRAIAANPFVAFTLVAEASATLVLRWTGDQAFDHVETVRIDVA
mgnify:CR=1 FL=1